MGILEAILAVFAGVGDWFVETLPAFQSLFWTTGSGGVGELTFLGILAIAGLAFSVVFLLFGVIQGFLHFRG